MTEEQLQQKCFTYAWNERPQTRGLLFHVPNGGARDKVTAKKMKQAGVIAGVSDFIFLWKGNTYFLELKRKGGKQSPKQIAWEDKVKMHSFKYFIVDSFEYFKILLDTLMSLEDDKPNTQQRFFKQ